MKMVIDYGHLTDADKANAALDDVREYLGEERFALFLDAARDYTLEDFSVFCEIVGIEGYPVTVLHKFANL